VSYAYLAGGADGGQMTFWLGRLSPRRRIFAAGAAAVLAVAVGVVTVITIRAADSGQGPQATSVPPQDRPGPVLLVPGYGGSTGSLSVLARRIRATGRRATVIHLPGNGTGSLIADAGALNAAVTSALRGAPSVDVIGYSAGGVVALLWEREYGGVYKARRVVTLGSPFHGAAIASAGEAFVPGACPAACQQLIPGSSLLRQLDAARVPARPRWLSIWTTDDKTVTPPDSARLDGAVNVPIQSICPALQVSHSQLPASPAVTAMVLGAIGPGPLRRPAASDCRA
jgi:triacylglycerol lipase